MSSTDEILSQIQSYLGNGGLFNPEMMDHEKVRSLIMDCREHMNTLRARAEQAEAKCAEMRGCVRHSRGCADE